MSEERSSAEIDIILKRIKELESEIEKLRKAGVSREEKEKLLQQLKAWVSASKEANIINIRIATTARGAIYRLKRGVWATLNRLHKKYGNQFDMEKSKNNWGRIATLIVKKVNEANLSEYPTKIIMTYDIIQEDNKYVFRPKEARILVFEPAGHLLITMEEAEKEEVSEEALKMEEEKIEEE